MLPPREAKWRYERRCTDIGDTLAGTSDAGKLKLFPSIYIHNTPKKKGRLMQAGSILQF